MWASEKEKTVVVADDHPLLLKGLCDFLEEKGMKIVGKSGNGSEALALIHKFKPALAIIDLEMPGMTGLEIAAQCQSKELPTKIILLTLHKELYLVHQARELNLSGYILKEFALSDLATAVDRVLDGQQFFSEKIFEENPVELLNNPVKQLTPSEKKILRMIATGARTKEIADALFISERTVEKHRGNIIQKLGLDGKHNSLLLWAQKNKQLIQ
ncbi:response regulator [Algoriphagus namhaensis]